MNRAFRPQATNKRFALQYRRKTGHGVGEFNWLSRVHWVRHSDRNRQHSVRVFGQLHYLGSHAPLTVRKKWRTIEQRFIEQRVPKNASFRYATEISSGRWL